MAELGWLCDGPSENISNVLKMHLKAQVDSTSQHDVSYSADPATVRVLSLFYKFQFFRLAGKVTNK